MRKTMNTLKQIAFCLAASAVLATGLLAQSPANPTTTTLAVALTGTVASTTPGVSTDIITLASCSGLVQNSVGQYLTLLYVDFEAMDVAQVVNLTACQLRVVRGAEGTKASLHNASATVYVGSPLSFFGSAGAGANLSGDKLGGCVAANEAVLPAINVNDGKIFNCYSSGQWIQTGFGTMGPPPSQRISAFCTGTAGSAETEYLNSAACSGATTLTATQVQVSPGTLYGLNVYSSAVVVGGAGKDVATVYKNGTATAITCTIAAAGTTCSDLTHSVATAAGDVIAVKWVTATSDTAANVSASIEKQ
jgi:hypothetical protein